MTRFHVRIKLGSVLAAFGGLAIYQLSPPHLKAAAIGADITTGFRNRGNGGGTSAFFTHSLLTSVGGVAMPAGPNATSSYFSFPIATGGKNIMNPVPVAAGVAIVAPQGATYSPVVGVNKRPKPAAPLEGEGMYSESGPIGKSVTGSAGVNIKDGYIYAKGGTAHATVAGTAAGASFDPVYMQSGAILDYNERLNASISLDNPGDSAGILLFGVDSRFVSGISGVDNLYENGFPIDQALWSLAMWATGNTAADLNVLLRINPQARATNVLNPAKSDNDIANSIKDQFVFENGTARLNNALLLPTGTTWNVSSGTYYGEGVNVGLDAAGASVPEPAGEALLGLGLLVVGRWVRQLYTGRKRLLSAGWQPQ